MLYKIFYRKVGSESNVNEMFTQELHVSVINKFKKREVYVRFKDNIQAAVLADTESLSYKIREVKYSLYVLDVSTKYSRVTHLTDKNSKALLDGFIKIVNKCNGKSNKLRFDQGKEFYKKLLKKWLEGSDIFIYSAYNNSKSYLGYFEK